MVETPIEMARRHVTEGERAVREQRMRVAQLRAAGRLEQTSVQLLEELETSLVLHRGHLNELKARGLLTIGRFRTLT